MKLIISSDTFLKTAPENPDLLPESDKVPLFVGEWLEIEAAAEYPRGHWQVKREGRKWYCFKRSSFIED